MNKKQFVFHLLRKAYSKHIHKHNLQCSQIKAKNNSSTELTQLAKETTDKLDSISSLICEILNTKANLSTNL